jgi:hypothetical protein
MMSQAVPVQPPSGYVSCVRCGRPRLPFVIDSPAAGGFAIVMVPLCIRYLHTRTQLVSAETFWEMRLVRDGRDLVAVGRRA